MMPAKEKTTKNREDMDAEITEAIIRSLRLDGTMSAHEIADREKLPYKSVLKLYEKMKNEGTIVVRALFDPEKVGRDIVAFILLKCQPSILGRDIDWVAMELKRNKNIDEVHYLIGEWDLLVKFRVTNIKEYHRLVTQEVLRVPGVFNAAGWISMKTYKEEAKYEVR